MDFKEHAEISRKTWHKEDISKERRLNHAKLGLIGEIGEIASCIKKNVGYGKEIDLVNLKEELGDFIYFLQRFIEESGLNIDLDDIYQDIKKCTDIDAISKTDNLFYFFFHDVACLVSSESIDFYDGIIISILSFEKKYNLTISDILQTNINKLKVRYGDDLEFSTDKAINRDLVKERKVLEG